MTDIEKLTCWHRAQIGTKEAPAGSNRQRYGALYGWNGVSWCCQYIWAGFRECGLERLFYGGGKTASCTALMLWAKKTGQWVTDGYREGDILLFNFNDDARAEHVGYCLGMQDGRVLTVEGNTSAGSGGSQDNGGCVAKKSRDQKLVLGAFRPQYEEATMTQEQFDAMMDRYLSGRAALAPDGWSAEARAWAETQGIVRGDERGMRYKAFPTREEIVQMLYNANKA